MFDNLVTHHIHYLIPFTEESWIAFGVWCR